MYKIIYTGQFKKSLKRCIRRGLNILAFTTVIDILQEKGELPEQYIPIYSKISATNTCAIPEKNGYICTFIERINLFITIYVTNSNRN